MLHSFYLITIAKHKSKVVMYFIYVYIFTMGKRISIVFHMIMLRWKISKISDCELADLKGAGVRLWRGHEAQPVGSIAFQCSTKKGFPVAWWSRRLEAALVWLVLQCIAEGICYCSLLLYSPDYSQTTLTILLSTHWRVSVRTSIFLV